jgi:hypothetical protein
MNDKDKEIADLLTLKIKLESQLETVKTQLRKRIYEKSKSK